MANRILEVVKRDQRIIQVVTDETVLPSMDLAINVNFDNTLSGLESTNLQKAIEELNLIKQDVIEPAKLELLLNSTASFTIEQQEKLAEFGNPEDYLTTNVIISGVEGGLIVGGGSLQEDVLNLDVALGNLELDNSDLSLEDSIPIIGEDGSQRRVNLSTFQTVSGFKLMGYCKPVPDDTTRMEICDRDMIGTGEFLEQTTPPPLDPTRPNRDGYAYEVLMTTEENQHGFDSDLEGDGTFETSHIFKHDIFVWTQDANIQPEGVWGLLSTGASIKSFNGRNGDITPLQGDYDTNLITLAENPERTLQVELADKANLFRPNTFTNSQSFDIGVVLNPMVELPTGTEGQIICYRDNDFQNHIMMFVNGVWRTLGTGDIIGTVTTLNARVTELEAQVSLLEQRPQFYQSGTEPAEARNGDTWHDTVNNKYLVRLANTWINICTGDCAGEEIPPVVDEDVFAEDVIIDQPVDETQGEVFAGEVIIDKPEETSEGLFAEDIPIDKAEEMLI